MSDRRLRARERGAQSPQGLALLALEQDRAGEHRLASRTARRAQLEGNNDQGIEHVTHATGFLARIDDKTLDAYFMDEKLATIDVTALAGEDSTLTDFAYANGQISLLTNTNGEYNLTTTHASGMCVTRELPDGQEPPMRLVSLQERSTLGILFGEYSGRTLETVFGEEVDFIHPIPLLQQKTFDISIGFTQPNGTRQWKAYLHINEGDHQGLTLELGDFTSLLSIDSGIYKEHPAGEWLPLHNIPKHKTTPEPRTISPPYGICLPPHTRLNEHRTTCPEQENLASLWDKNAKRALLETPMYALEGLLAAYENSRGAR